MPTHQHRDEQGGPPVTDATGTPGEATAASVTAADALHAPFRMHRWLAGYDPDQVDDFLDTVAVALAALEAGQRLAMTVSDVFDVQFAQARFRVSYHMDDVDDFLDRVASTFTAAKVS